MGLSKGISIIKITSKKREKLKDQIVCEVPLTILVNREELVSLQCSPDKLEYLAVGFLLSEDLIKKDTKIKHITVNEKDWYIMIDLEEDILNDKSLFFKKMISSGCGGGITFRQKINTQSCAPLTSQTHYSHQEIFDLMKQLHKRSLTFRNTGGVHSCALCSQEGIEVFAEDIGRHNAVDKVFGECFIEGISTEDKLILTTGRVSSDILIKVAKQKVPVIASHSAPTDLAINMAAKLNLTLVGFVRGNRMNIYTHTYRIT